MNQTLKLNIMLLFIDLDNVYNLEAIWQHFVTQSGPCQMKQQVHLFIVNMVRLCGHAHISEPE